MSLFKQQQEVLTPKQLHDLAVEKAKSEARKELDVAAHADEEKRHMHEAFMAREVRPDVMERIMPVVRRAAEQGQTEVLVLQFPASYLSDGGRRINNFEPDWPKSLEGFAKNAFDFWQEHLRPHGYKLRAQILDYPGGNLGDVGLYLCW